jgi:hypothetical protein
MSTNHKDEESMDPNHNNNEDEGFILFENTPAYRRGKHNKKQNKKKSSLPMEQGEIPVRIIPKFYKGEVFVVSKNLLSLQHSSSIQNHILNDENLYHLELTVAKTTGLQGHYYLGDETGAIQWITNANNNGHFLGYFPIGSQIRTKEWHNSFIILQLKYKTLKDIVDMKNVYSPVFHLMLNKDKPFTLLPKCERPVLLCCAVIAINPGTGKALIGRRKYTEHYSECMYALEHHFNERSKHRYAPLRYSFFCNKKALETWTDSELESIAHFCPKYSPLEHKTRRESWRRYWIFDEMLLQLSDLADEELNRRKSNHIKQHNSCWAFPNATCAYMIENKRYRLEAHHETAKRAFQYETGIPIRLTAQCPFFDHKSVHTVEENLCFDRYFIYFTSTEDPIDNMHKHGFSDWKWISIKDTIADKSYNPHLTSILSHLQDKLQNMKSTNRTPVVQ